MEHILSYPVTDTLNDAVNYEKLDIVLKANSLGTYMEVYPFRGKINIRLSEAPDATKQATIDGIISTHDGAAPQISEELVEARKKAFHQMAQMAHYHPLLDSNDTNAYLTEIDNWKNAFITDGVSTNLVAKITADKDDTGGAFHTYLNTIVNPDLDTTADYLIGQITAIASL